MEEETAENDALNSLSVAIRRELASSYGEAVEAKESDTFVPYQPPAQWG